MRGEEPDAIPIADYEKLVAQLPTPHELKRYTSARVASVVRDYAETPVDAEKLYRNYVEKRINRNAIDFRTQFLQQDAKKYKFLLEKLKQMLSKEETYPESAWQAQILQIILLRHISLGGKPNWTLLTATALAVFGLTTYFLTLTFWIR